MFPVHFFRSPVSLLPTLSSSPNWAIFVSHLELLFSCPCRLQELKHQATVSYRAYFIQCSKLKLTHGVYFQTVRALCHESTFFHFLSVRWAVTRCTQALLMSWLMRTSIRKMHSWSMMASRGSGPLRIVGRLGASSTGRRPPTSTAGTMAAQLQF